MSDQDEATDNPQESAPLRIEALEVNLPDGSRLFRATFALAAGQVAALMGPSGSGKTTFLRALFDRPALEASGFRVSAGEIAITGEVAMVPQGGAPFDHLDVAGNIGLVLRNRKPSTPSDRAAVVEWLGRVDLPATLAEPGTTVRTLSGGMVQRLCIARALAAGRDILILDEPSAGLDLARVEELATELRKQAQSAKVAVLIVTHDTLLAALGADEVYFFGGSPDGFGRVDLPLVTEPPEQRREALEGALRGAGSAAKPRSAQRTPKGKARLGWIANLFGSVRQPVLSLWGILASLRAPLRDRLDVLGHAYTIGFGAPALFYLVVSVLFGYTVLYVVSTTAPHGISAATAVRLIGGSYIVALTPPLSSILFVACSGATINAWLATMGLTGQVEALRSLGISPRRYLWGPVFEALLVSYALVAILFGFGLMVGGLFLSHAIGLQDALSVFTEDLFYPRPERVASRVRAIYLMSIYSVGIASEVVWRASRPMRESREVPRSMTTSVIIVTLWVVVCELVTALWLFDIEG